MGGRFWKHLRPRLRPVETETARDVKLAFAIGKNTLRISQISSEAIFFNYAHSLAEQFGWAFGGPIAGHLIGQLLMKGPRR